MDLTNITLTVLFAIGAVNVVLFFYPNIDSKLKFAISIVAAFIAFFIPADLGGVILNAAKEALSAAVIASGVYKLSTKVGGN